MLRKNTCFKIRRFKRVREIYQCINQLLSSLREGTKIYPMLFYVFKRDI